MTDDLDERLTQTLRSWSSKHLFTGDQGEFRANVKLNQVSDRICFNTFSQNGKLYPLPTADGYLVYSFPTQALRGMRTNEGTGWVDGASYLNTLQTRLFVYDNHGKLFPLSQVWLFTGSSKTYLAVNKNAYLMCATGGLAHADELYLTFWINPHPENPISVKEYCPVLDNRVQTWGTDKASALAAINAVKDSDTTYTSILVNGVYTTPENVSLGTKDYISIITETDIFCKFKVTIDDNVTGYESSLYKDYREILHMPKALNPNKYILTHDLIEVVIRDSDSNRGLHQTRYDYRSVRQITHQDYSIDRTDADSLRDTLHASSIYAEVIVRNPINVRTLGGDSNYIADLYRVDDSTIVSFLRGSAISGMEFWSASVLEASPYISLIFSNTIKGEPSDAGYTPEISDYLKALGFYNTITVLDGGSEVGLWDQSMLVATAPEILSGRTLLPYVYVNGRKLPQREITSTVMRSNKIELALDDSNLVKGDKISILLKDFTETPVETIAVSDSNTTFVPKNDDFKVYSYDDGKITAVSRSTATYRTDSVNGSTELTFYPQMYGKSVYVHYPNNAVWGSIDIDNLLSDKESLLFSLVDKHGHPVILYNSLDVFVNGYWCIRDIDYCVYQDTVTKQTKIAICNRNFLNFEEEGNVIEWFAYGDKIITDDFDYIIENRLRHKTTPYLYENNVSEVYGEGLYQTKVGNEGTYLATTGLSQASVGEHVLRFPYILYNALGEDSRLSDDARRVIISNYFKNAVPAIPEQIMMNTQHQVYSPWLHYLIVSLVSGNLDAVNDPDVVSFIKQFPDVNGLRDHDPAINRNSRMDKQYLAIAAAYTLNMPDTSAYIRAIVQKLISLTLIRDLSSLGVTPV